MIVNKTELLLFSALFVCIYSCHKKDKADIELPFTPRAYDTTELKLGPSTVWIDSVTATMLSRVDSNYLLFEGNSLQLSKLKPGDIIVSSVLPNAPNGFMGKINSVKHNGNQYQVIIAPASLTEAFEKIYAQCHMQIKSNDIKARLNLGVSLPNLILYDGDKDIGTKEDQVKLEGNIEFTPSLDFLVDISAFTLRQARFGATLQIDKTFKVTMGRKLTFLKKEAVVFEKQLNPIPLGPAGLIVLTPKLVVTIGVEGTAKIEVSYEYTKTTVSGAYLVYDGQTWNKIEESSDEATATSKIDASGELEAKLYLQPAIELTLYGQDWIKGYVQPKGYIKASARINPKPGCEIATGVSASIGLDLSLFNKTYASLNYEDFYDHNKVIYRCCCGCGLGITSVQDVEGNTYGVVTIGNQAWMKENLKTTHYANGDPIVNLVKDSDWSEEHVNFGAWSDNGGYGKHYNWYATADPRGLCPVGWHIPDSLEWESVFALYGGKNFAGTAFKAMSGWGNGSGTNESCFTALPGGWREPVFGRYIWGNTYGSWWSSNIIPESTKGESKFEQAWNFIMYYDAQNIGIGAFSTREGMSVRCVKNSQ